MLFIFFLGSKSYSTDSPRGYSSSKSYPNERSSSRAYNSHSESMDWQKAAEAWARSKNRDSSGKFYNLIDINWNMLQLYAIQNCFRNYPIAYFNNINYVLSNAT